MSVAEVDQLTGGEFEFTDETRQVIVKKMGILSDSSGAIWSE